MLHHSVPCPAMQYMHMNISFPPVPLPAFQTCISSAIHKEQKRSNTSSLAALSSDFLLSRILSLKLSTRNKMYTKRTKKGQGKKMYIFHHLLLLQSTLSRSLANVQIICTQDCIKTTIPHHHLYSPHQTKPENKPGFSKSRKQNNKKRRVLD